MRFELFHLTDVGADVRLEILQHRAAGLVEQRCVEFVHLLNAFDDLAERILRFRVVEMGLELPQRGGKGARYLKNVLLDVITRTN